MGVDDSTYQIQLINSGGLKYRPTLETKTDGTSCVVTDPGQI